MKPVLVACFIAMLLMACKKDEKPFMNEGVITGYDGKLCSWCGGLMINFNGDTVKYASPYYQIAYYPQGYPPIQFTKFPVRVSVDWKADTDKPEGRWIIITLLKVHK